MYYCTLRKSECVLLYREQIRVCTIVQRENQSLYHCTERKSDFVPLYKTKIRYCTILQCYEGIKIYIIIIPEENQSITKCYVPYNLIHRIKIISIRNHKTFIFSYILCLDYNVYYTIFFKSDEE